MGHRTASSVDCRVTVWCEEYYRKTFQNILHQEKATKWMQRFLAKGFFLETAEPMFRFSFVGAWREQYSTNANAMAFRRTLFSKKASLGLKS